MRGERWIFWDLLAAVITEILLNAFKVHTVDIRTDGMLKMQISFMLMHNTNWLEGFLVMLRTDRFTCQQTFAVHRSTNLQRYMLGVKMCITAIPQQSIRTRQTSSSLWAASRSPSVCLSWKHCLCSFFIQLIWPNNINNLVFVEQFITSPDRGR